MIKAMLFCFTKKIITRLLAYSGKNILDVGCGCAPISSVVADRNKVVGIDLSESALHKASQEGINCISACIEDGLPFKEKQWNL